MRLYEISCLLYLFSTKIMNSIRAYTNSYGYCISKPYFKICIFQNKSGAKIDIVCQKALL